jgi:Fic-DOC domain mobile mystery protein B
MKPAEPTAPHGRGADLTEQEQAMLLPSLSTRAQLNEIEALALNAARVWAMRAPVLQRKDILSEAFARELHRRMFAAVWRDAGRYRTAPRMPGWEPGQIAEGVRMSLDDAEGWLRFSNYSVHESAVRIHHRLVAVCPWANGNGRHARLVADVVVASHGEEPLTWGRRSGLVEAGPARLRYLDAVKAADSGNMGPLLEFARG